MTLPLRSQDLDSLMGMRDSSLVSVTQIELQLQIANTYFYIGQFEPALILAYYNIGDVHLYSGRRIQALEQDPEKALEHFIRYKELSDSLNNAIYAVNKNNDSPKIITISTAKEENKLLLTFSNSGPPIEVENTSDGSRFTIKIPLD
jgi:hypothetical protein